MNDPTGTRGPGAPRGISVKRVAGNTVAGVAATGVTWATKGLLAVLVARALGPRGLGDFTVAWTIAGMLGTFAPLGLSSWLAREIGRRGADTDRDAVTSLAAVLGLVFAVGVAIAPAVLQLRPSLQRALWVAAVYVAIAAWQRVVRASFHGREKVSLDLAAGVVQGGMTLAGAWVAARMGAGAAGYMLACTVGAAGGAVFSLYLYRRLWGSRLRFVRPGRSWRAALRQSFPMGLTYAFTTLLLRVDVLLVGAIVGAAGAGLYGAASWFVLTLPLVATALSSALFPGLARSGSVSDESFARPLRIAATALAVAGAAGCAATLLVGTDALVWLFGAGFEAAVPVVRVLAIVLPFRFVNTILGTALNASDRQTRRTVAVGIGAAFNVLTNLILIPTLGVVGAAWATVLTEALVTACFLWALRPGRSRLPGSVTLRPVPGVEIHLRSEVALSRRLSRWVDGCVLPLAEHPVTSGDEPRRLEIRFVDEVPHDPATRLPGIPGGPGGPRAVWVADHVGRAASLPLADLSVRPVLVDRRMDPAFFHLWVFLPLMRALLASDGGCLMRASGASAAGRRIAFAGWKTTGKTTATVALLDRERLLIGDDSLAATPSGVVGGSSAQLFVRLPTGGTLPRRAHRSFLRRLHVVVRGILDRGDRPPGRARVLEFLLRTLDDATAERVALREACPGARLSEPGPLDTLMLLTPPCLGVPRPSDVATMLAAQASVSYAPCAALEAAFRYAFPGVLAASPFPEAAADRAALERVLHDTDVIAVPFNRTDESLDRVLRLAVPGLQEARA